MNDLTLRNKLALTILFKIVFLVLIWLAFFRQTPTFNEEGQAGKVIRQVNNGESQHAHRTPG